MSVKKRQNYKPEHKLDKKLLIFLLVIALAFYIFLPQVGNFKGSYEAFKSADPYLLTVALLIFIITYFAAAAVYSCIAMHRLKYFKTVVIQVATSFSNRLLPAGTGALATSARYLSKNKHDSISATAVAGLNNMLGFVSHILVFLVILIISGTWPSDLRYQTGVSFILVAVIACLIISGAAIIAYWPRARKIFYKLTLSLWKNIQLIGHRPLRLGAALLLGMVLTSCNALALYLCALAIGVEITVLQTFLIFTTGVIVGSATPTPGGLGGVEAGLVAGFRAVGVPADLALSVTLTYRFITYWIPILPGYICFQLAIKKDWL